MRPPTITSFQKHELSRRYMTVIGSLRAMSLELKLANFCKLDQKLWEQRSSAISSAYEQLLEAKDLPPKKHTGRFVFEEALYGDIADE